MGEPRPRPERRLLPHGRRDALRQILLFVGAYLLYQVVRGLVNGSDVSRASFDATRVIDLERALHVFVEPAVQAWALHLRWLMDISDWIYLNAHDVVTGAALVFIYLRRNDSFYFVRNMFMIAMAIALVGYVVYPTAPPRLMPEWGFTDAIAQFTPFTADRGAAAAALLNLYAAIPSMHVCFALMTGVPMSRFVRHRHARIAWLLYTPLIVFVVVVTGNHYLTDVFLGVVTAGVSALLASQLLARARPDVWTFRRAGDRPTGQLAA